MSTSFDLEEIRKARQRPLRPEMGMLPTEKELQNAIRKLRNGKAAGESGILPEMVKVACDEEEFLSKLLQLVHEVWTECTVPRDWRDAILVPIPKKVTSAVATIGEAFLCWMWLVRWWLESFKSGCRSWQRMNSQSLNVVLEKVGAVQT